MPKDAFIRAQSAMLERFNIAAESSYVPNPTVGGQAHVLVTGMGPNVVMVNGIGTPAAMWAPLMAELGGFALHAIDLPGYGLSDANPAFVDDYRANAVRFLREALDGLALETTTFIASSLGSLWTIWLAIEEPDRVTGMVHIGCPALSLGTSASVPMRMLSAPPLGRVMMKVRPPSPKQVEQLSKMVREYPLTPELAELLLATERLPGFEPTFLASLHKLVRLRGPRPDLHLTAEQLAGVGQPTQLIWGKDDPMGSPSVGERMTAIMPDAELHVVDGGHTPWLTQAEEISRSATPFLHKHTVANEK